jgi:predicted Zn finger-like uncharacterized protein
VIIDCICGKKKFKVSEDQIPQEGRKVQCGSCSQVWYYTPPPIRYTDEDEIIEQNFSQQQLEVTKNDTEDNYKEDSKVIEKNVKAKKPDRNYSLRKGIYLTFLLLFSVSIFLLPFKNKVIEIFPFLKGYLDILTKVIFKLFKILNII